MLHSRINSYSFLAIRRKGVNLIDHGCVLKKMILIGSSFLRRNKSKLILMMTLIGVAAKIGLFSHFFRLGNRI